MRIKRARKSCSAPCEKAGSSAPKQSRTSCHRRSTTVSSTASASHAPAYACSNTAIAINAGGTGDLPAPASRCPSKPFVAPALRTSVRGSRSQPLSGRCCRKTAKKGLTDRTYLIISADHGEGFGGEQQQQSTHGLESRHELAKPALQLTTHYSLLTTTLAETSAGAACGRRALRPAAPVASGGARS